MSYTTKLVLFGPPTRKQYSRIPKINLLFYCVIQDTIEKLFAISYNYNVCDVCFEYEKMKGVDSMKADEINSNSIPETLAKKLDKGIEDMESGKELPLDEAFDLVADLVGK